MTDQELNEKLARWRGFKENLWAEHRGWVPSEKGYEGCESIDFPNDLNAIFKWLVPKVQPIIIRISVDKDYNDTDKLTYCCELKRNMGLFVMSAWLASGKADTPSLALCRAIEQMIDGKHE